MVGRLQLVLITLVVASVVWCPAQAGEHHRRSPDLFYNYYVPPAGCGGVGAGLYPCPRPTPPVVGRTYVTYQPLMPHEFMYPHHRTYLRRNCQGGCTITCVSWKRDWDLFGWLHRPPKIVNAPQCCPKCSH